MIQQKKVNPKLSGSQAPNGAVVVTVEAAGALYRTLSYGEAQEIVSPLELAFLWPSIGMDFDQWLGINKATGRIHLQGEAV